ncbi:MAG: hypothetical protein WAT39_26640 [Planctomycetota bacterium]
MWLIGVVGAAAIVAVAVAVVRSAWPRVAADEPRPRANAGLLAAAALALAGAVALALWAAFVDFHERTYQVAWLVVGPGCLALAGVAYALFTLALPRPHRGRGAEVFAWIAVVIAFGIGTCYASIWR